MNNIKRFRFTNRHHRLIYDKIFKNLSILCQCRFSSALKKVQYFMKTAKINFYIDFGLKFLNHAFYFIIINKMQNPKCINNSAVELICIDQQCTQINPFICKSCNNNKCRKIHQKCDKKKWVYFKMKLDSKINQNQNHIKLIEKIQNHFNTIIKLISQQKQFFLKWKQNLSYFQIMNYFQTFSQPNQTKIKGKDIYELLKNIQKKQSSIKIEDQIFIDIWQAARKINIDLHNLYHQNKMEYKKQQTKNQTIKEQKQQIVQIFTIKQQFLHNLNERINSLTQKPEIIQLKFVQLILIQSLIICNIRK